MGLAISYDYCIGGGLYRGNEGELYRGSVIT